MKIVLHIKYLKLWDITDTVKIVPTPKETMQRARRLPTEEGKTMQKYVVHLKKEWKVYAMGIWMLGVTGFLYCQNGQIQAIKQTQVKLSSDVDSIESILIGTDGNVDEMKKQVAGISSRVKTIHKRVMRR